MKENAIIVGSGVGGIALSVLLAKEGYNTTVYEKNHIIGGRCTSYEKIHDGERYIVDMWTHAFPTADRTFNKIFKKAKIDYGIKFYHFTNDNPPQIWGEKGRKISFPIDISNISEEIEQMQEYQKEWQNDYNIDPVDFTELSPKITKMISDIFFLPKKKLKELDNINFEDWIRSYTDNEQIINQLGTLCAFMFVNMAYDSKVKRGSAAGETIRAMRNWFSQVSSGYPLGGTVGIVNGYREVFENLKGTVVTKKKVDKIIIENEEVVGVEIEGDFVKSNLVISNAGIKETIIRLVGEKFFPKEYVETIKKLEVSEGAGMWGFYSIKFGVDEKLVQPPIIFPMLWTDRSKRINSIRELIEEYIMKDTLPPSGGMFTTIPSNMDPSLAPSGKQIINMGCIGPVKSSNYQKWIDFYTDILEVVIPHFRKHILFMDVHRTGAPLQAWTGRFQGDAVGISQSVGQVGEKRPSPKPPFIKGLFFVGADIGRSGIGTEMSALSALTTYEAIKNH